MTEERIAGGSLILAGIAFASFWLSSVFDPPGDAPWILGLALHGVGFMLLAVGLFLVGRHLEATDWTRTAWWTGAGMVVVGSVGGWPLLAIGLVALGAVEISWRRLPVGSALALGGALLFGLYLGGTVIGDENSRPPDDLERTLAAAGVTLVAAGLGLLGAAVLRGRLRTSEPG